MTTNVAISGWYVMFPESSAWIAVKINNAGDVVAIVEEANAATHIAAGDRSAWICEAVRNSETDEQVTAEDAAAVVEAYDSDMDYTCCVVMKILE